METLPYNKINGPKNTVKDYLQRMSNDELLNIYNSSFFYGVQIPDLLKKLKRELENRKLDTQPVLF
jgi:hypothetical protein